MIGFKQQKSADDVLTLLREAWHEAKAAGDALEQACKYETVNDLRKAFLMQAARHIEQSKSAIEEAGKRFRT